MCCRTPCNKMLERRAQALAENVALHHLMLKTPAHMVNWMIHMRTLLLRLSPSQLVAADAVLELVAKKVPRDWSLEGTHSFVMWASHELQYVVEQVNEMELQTQSQAMIAAEAEALLREQGEVMWPTN